MMKTYRVTVTRDDDLWAAIIDGLPEHVVGAADYERFEDLQTDLPYLIADLADLDIGDFVIEWRFEIGGRDVTRALMALFKAEERLRDSQVVQEEARRDALKAMADAGLSQREMADVVRLSHQRVHQLLKAS